MSLSSVSIRRPVLAIILSATIVVFGLIGFNFLGVREYPVVDPPVISVFTSYPGANADVIESQITQPIEEVVSGIPGIRVIKSTSREQASNITIEFNLGVDLETAANDVRDKVSQAFSRIPPDANPPVVQKADANAQPIAAFTVSSDRRNLLDLTDVARNVIRERIRTVEGVSEVAIWGEKVFAMRVWMNPDKLVAYQLTPQDVRNAIARENIELPTGRIEGTNTELTIRTMGRLSSVEDFNSLIIRESNGTVIRMRDIGYAELGAENYKTLLRREGVPMVALAIIPQPGSNYIDIINGVRKRLEDSKKDFPPDIQVGVSFDNTKFIRSSIEEVTETIYIAFGLVTLVIFIFLRDVRTTLIPIIAIPISLVGSFFIMYVAGFSINILTLLGIVLAIGIVVDDAIVVLENIYAKIEQGENPYTSALNGSAEVYLAVIATTMALAAVFMPVIFLQGLTGRLFREFGVVLAGSVVISAFVSLTLTPMMASRLLRHQDKPSWLYRVTEPFFAGMTHLYNRSLVAFMKVRWMAFVIMALSIGAIVWTVKILPTELSPTEDREGFRVNAVMPEGTTFNAMDAYITDLTDVIAEQTPEREGLITITAPGFTGGSSNTGSMRIILKPRSQRVRSQQQIAASLSKTLRSKNNARAFTIQEPSISTGGPGGRSLPLSFVIKAPDLGKLKKVLPKILDEASRNPVFDVVDVDVKFNKPEVVIDVLREKARTLGISTQDIIATMQAGLSGQRYGFFLLNGKQYQVIGQVQQQFRDKPSAIRSLNLRSANNELIPIDNVISINERSSPPQLFRFDRYVSATISAGLAQGVTLGQGIDVLESIARKHLDETFSTALDGQARDLRESSSSLIFAFVLALLLIYMVLAAQFESFRDPLTILLTVPLALAGALLTLWMFNQTVNIFSQIGIIMLIGLVAKNGILIVEFANQRREQGSLLGDAIIEASTARLRPILMTSITAILGTLPIALALGAGAESRVSMGIAIIGGLVFSTFLTLYVVPAMYSYITTKAMHSRLETDLNEQTEASDQQTLHSITEQHLSS
jgi:multidrug efflux pump